MKEVLVNLKKQIDLSYPVLIGPGLLEKSASILAGRFSDYAFAVVSDSNVSPLYAGTLAGTLRKMGRRCEGPIAFPAGEQSKNRAFKRRIEDRMFRAKLGRDTVVVAVGGGVVGDLAGFVAATYARGLPLVQVPTSLLAMVDSSIGGKTGVDVPWGKNLVGAFHQPSVVLIDPRVLATLEKDQFVSGLAEVVKHGVIRDAGLFAFLEKNRRKLVCRDEDLLAALVETNCRIKALVVAEDERESNLRKILNFGHTVGHALEKLSGYSWLHGQAVSVGMLVEAEIASMLGLLAGDEKKRLENLLRSLGLPVSLDSLKVSAAEAVGLTYLDKKARKGRPEYVLPAGIGKMALARGGGYGIAVEDAVVSKALILRGALA